MPICSHHWRLIGAVTFVSGVPVFPENPTNPSKAAIAGLYRLTFDNGFVYIGQTTNLRRRLGEYRKPTQGTEQEHVISRILLDAHGAKVEVFTEGDLSQRSTRCDLEDTAKECAKTANLPLLNKGGLGYGHYLKFKIKYHEEMLAKATVELQQLKSSQ